MTLDRRDGSLLRRKREQWAREKAEEANNNWFPFGSPGGGTPNRKFEAIEYTTIANDAKNSAMVADTSTSSCNNRSKLADSHILNNGTSENMTFTNESTFNEQIPPIMLNHQIQSTNHQELNQSTHMINSSHQQLYPFSFGFNPFPNDLGGTSIPVSSSMPWSYPYPVPLSLLPPGMKPVLQQDPNKPIPDSVCILPFISNGPEAQVTYWKQPVFAHAIDIPQNSSLSVDENDYEGLHNNQGYIDVSKNVLREEIKEKDSPEICERSYLDEIRGSEPNHCCHQNKQTIHEVINEERKEEEKINKQRMLEEALEKAKMEAEVMRKARLYHHVLKAADGSPELEKKYLGADSETVHRIQHELAVMDRQKLLLREELVKMLPNNKKKSDGEAKLKSMSHSQSTTFTCEEGYSCSEKQAASVRPCISEGKSSRSRNGIQNSVLPTTPITNTHHSKEYPCEEQIASLRACTPMNKFIAPGTNVQNDDKLISRRTTTQTTPASRLSISRRSSQMTLPLSFKKNEPSTRSQEQLYTANNFPGKTSRTSSAEISMNPLFSPVFTRSRQKRRVLTDSLINMSSTDSVENQRESENDALRSHVSIQSYTPENFGDTTIDLKKTISSSSSSKAKIETPLSSPISCANAIEKRSPLCLSLYAKKLAEKGCDKHEEDILSPDLRRISETCLSRTSSLQNLRGSFSNLLSLRDPANNLDINIEESSNLGRFRSMNPNYRSFNIKKTSDKQQEVLDRLNKLRKQLRSKENFMERGTFNR